LQTEKEELIISAISLAPYMHITDKMQMFSVFCKQEQHELQMFSSYCKTIMPPPPM
jgi:hypothetical protein